MRLVGTVMFLALSGSLAAADDAKPAEAKEAPAAAPVRAKVPLRVVKMLPETHQALLFEKNRGVYVLAEVGQTVNGYAVEDIDDDEVVLVAGNGAEIVLAAPAAAPAPAAVKAAPAKVEAKAEPAPVDPYAEKPAAAPEDPYAAPADGAAAMAPATVAASVMASAPATATAPATASVPATAPATAASAAATAPAAASAPATATAPAPATASAPATAATASAPATATAPATAAAPAPAAASVPAAAGPPAWVAAAPSDAPAPAPDVVTFQKAEMHAALGDFGKLAASIRATFVPAGAKVEALQATSLFARAGLRVGDVITAVDNRPLHSLDDAAELYARAGSARSFSVSLVRADKPITLHIAIQ